jgi:membrane-associated phospholipid phosphatase
MFVLRAATAMMGHRRFTQGWLAVALGLATFSWKQAALGQSAASHPPLRFEEPWLDGLVTGVGFIGWVATSSAESTFAPASCRWCNPPAFDSSVRNALRWSNTTAANALSNVTFAEVGFGVLSFNLMAATQAQPDGGYQTWSDFFTDAAVIAEATVLAADFNQATRLLTGRERPFVHALPATEKGGTASPADNNVSFYSMHTSTAMALAVSMAEVASLRRYDWAPVAWVTLPTLSLATGYFRIASDKHYLTDVAAGAVMGAAFGYFIPYWFHRPHPTTSGSGIVSLRPMIVAGSRETLLGAAGSF